MFNIFAWLYKYINRYIYINCVNCSKAIHIHKKYANKYLCCSNNCGYNFFINGRFNMQHDNDNNDNDNLL